MLLKLAAVAALAHAVSARVTLGEAILEKLDQIKSAVSGQHGNEESQGEELPDFFDMRTVWWGCGSTVHNQGQCGSCWAASSTGVLNDRFCIHKDINDEPLEISRYGAGAVNRAFMEAGSCDKANTLPHDHGCTKRTIILSPQRLVSCATMTVFPRTYNDSAGCNGGNAADAWHYFHVHGVSAMSGDHNAGCTPYVSGKCLLKDPHNNGCLPCIATEECADSGLAPKIYRVGDYGKIRDPGQGKFNVSAPVRNATALANQIRMLKEEIYANGPVQTCFAFPANFQQFFNEHPLGIYNTTFNQTISGSHCVALTGWGVDRASGMKYWIVRNSWGAEFGTRGYYRWKMGENLCGIEHEAWTGCPLNSKTCRLTAGVQVMQPDENDEAPLPYRNDAENDIAFGGKWMEHDGTSQLAQQWAHEYARRASDDNEATKYVVLQPGDYNVMKLQTKVTNGVLGRVVMTLPGANGPVEALMRMDAGNKFSVLESGAAQL